MPLVTSYNAVKEIYEEAVERGIGLPVFCAEGRETLEAILASALCKRRSKSVAPGGTKVRHLSSIYV